MPSNADRADWAYSALEAFAKRTRQDTSGDLKHAQYTVVTDLLADLMHLCDRDGIDFETCLIGGRGHYEEELQEEAEACSPSKS